MKACWSGGKAIYEAKNCTKVLQWKPEQFPGPSLCRLSGKNGGLLAQKADVCIKVPEACTADVQELHMPIYHCISRMLENEFFL